VTDPRLVYRAAPTEQYASLEVFILATVPLLVGAHWFLAFIVLAAAFSYFLR
jgi:hypothetical protein